MAAARLAHEYCHMMHDDDFEFETLNTRNSEYDLLYFMATIVFEFGVPPGPRSRRGGG